MEEKEILSILLKENNIDKEMGGLNQLPSWAVKIIEYELSQPQEIYGVVEWVNKHPILNGMQAFIDKASAIKYCGTRLSGQVDKDIYAEQTIINITVNNR